MKALIVDALASQKGERKTTRDAIGAGPRALAGILERKGITASISEAETIIAGGPIGSYDFLLVSGMTSDITSIRKVISTWKGGPIVLGGPVSSDPLQAIRKTNCDFVVIGEGEETLNELLEKGLGRVEMDRVLLQGIKGVAYKNRDNVEVTPLRRVMPRAIFDGFKPSTKAINGYTRFHSARVYVEVLRGCSNYYRALIYGNCKSCRSCRSGSLSERYNCPLGTPPGCGYCSVPSLYGPPKSRSVDMIKEEVIELIDEGVSRVVLSAPCFLDYGRDLLVEPEPLTDPAIPEPNYREVERLLSSLADIPKVSEGTVTFWVENLKASLVTEKAAELLGKYLTGTPVSIGFETGSELHSYSLGRPSTPSQTLTAVSRLKKVGLKPYVYFIHGLPGQNKNTVNETLKAINQSMEKGAERIILYRFQSLPMSAFSSHPSAPPSNRDHESRRIYEAAARANTKVKENMLGRIIRVVVAEKYNKDRRLFVAYPIKHGPVVLVESTQSIEGKVLDIKVTRVVSDRMVHGVPVAMF